MTKKWLEMRLAVPDRTVDLVSQVLVDHGCRGITAAQQTLDTFVVPSPDALANDPVLRAYFTYPEDTEALRQEVQKALAELAGIFPELTRVDLELEGLADQDWASDWRQHFPPFRVGKRLVIRPSWVEWPATDNQVVLTLDPGQAFGTGTHATTSLCLEALSVQYESALPPQRVLDVGTGSGILAMACAALGATEVVACDIDAEACLVATKNVQHNQLSRQVTITDMALDQIAGQYDLVLANILAGENLRLAPLLVGQLAPAGHLVLSGILIEQEQMVLDGFADFPLTLQGSQHRDDWTCIVYQRHE